MATRLTKAQREHLAKHLRNLVARETNDTKEMRAEARQFERDHDHWVNREALARRVANFDQSADRHDFEAASFAACLALVMEAESEGE